MSGFSGLKIQGVILTEATLFTMSHDDKIVLIAETIADHYKLKTISNIGSPTEHANFVSGVFDWDSSCAEAKRLRILLEGLDEASQIQYVDESLRRTRQAISKYSSLAPRPRKYFWFMVERIHGKEGEARLRSLSDGLRKRTEAIEKVKVAA